MLRRVHGVGHGLWNPPRTAQFGLGMDPQLVTCPIPLDWVCRAGRRRLHGGLRLLAAPGDLHRVLQRPERPAGALQAGESGQPRPSMVMEPDVTSVPGRPVGRGPACSSLNRWVP